MSNAEIEDFVNRVRERSDIRDVVSRYLPLNFKGGRYWACCPFHNEKTPSFTITPDRGLFYCFGCHAGGNVFKFISLMENISYFDAVKLQAERLGIELPKQKKSPQELKLENERKALQKIVSFAQDFYHDCLKKDAAGRKYFASRGITSGVIEKFKLGYAPAVWDELTKALKKRGYDDLQLIEAGVAVAGKNSGAYDRLRGRVIIPIADIFGNAVAFGGRILTDGNEPKYLNTPETKIFSKGKLLFGLDKASRAISAANCAIVVEGYMDVISLASAGVENVVATLGTAFTEDQAKLLARYARKIIFCYDSDDAGQRATLRALPIMQKFDVEIFVIVVPDSKDPDEFIRKHGKTVFDKLIEDALPVIDYRIKHVLSHADISSTDGQFKALREILPVLAEVKDPVTIAAYRQKVAEAFLLSENSVLEELNNFSARNLNRSSSAKSTPKTYSENSVVKRAGGAIIKTIWYENDKLDYVLTLLSKEIFVSVHREILSYLEKCYENDRHPNDLSAADEISDEANAEIARILSNGAEELTADDSLAFEESIKFLRQRQFKIQYEEVKKKSKNAINLATKLLTRKNSSSYSRFKRKWMN